jgi:membrane-associated protease RseP (regulator of RpoE activity)
MIRKTLIAGLIAVFTLMGLASGANAQPTLKPDAQPTLKPGLKPDRFPMFGLKVFNVVPGSPAARVGFEPGDIIVSVNGQPVSSLADLNRELSRSIGAARLEVLDARTGIPTRTFVRPIDGRIGVYVTPVPLYGYQPFDPFLGKGSPQKP